MSPPTFRMFYKGKVVGVAWHQDDDSPTEFEAARRQGRKRLMALLGLLLIGLFVFWRFVPDIPVDYEDPVEHFKYGSIGTEAGNGLPYWIWKVLPAAFPEHLPGGAGGGGYASFGFTYEQDKDKKDYDTPIGFSKRRMTGFDRVGLNCAVCHTSTYREAVGGEPTVVLAMPAHKLDLLGYFKFIFDCADDGRFTTEYILARIDARTKLGPIERALYKVAIPITRERVLGLKARAKFMLEHPSGPGRIDTFTPYKAVQFSFPDVGVFHVGNADFPSIWNQKPREGLDLHWDGNNSSVDERNKSASIGAGATPVSLDIPRLDRIHDWIWTLPPPAYPSTFDIDKKKAEDGSKIYGKNCAGCHDVGAKDGYQVPGGGAGYRVGQVVNIKEIGTDRERLDSYSLDLNQNQYALGSGTTWRFTHFRKTDGYSSMPLDGTWARGPYLHNGSAPTILDLLAKPYSREELDKLGLPGIEKATPDEVKQWVAKARNSGHRPPLFYRGDDVFDRARIGFDCDRPAGEGRSFRLYDVRVLGNFHSGHLYGTDLEADEKDALVEHMKSL